MQAQEFLETLNCDFFTGVPDSLLKPLCDLLLDKYGSCSQHHLVCANEGNAAAAAAGHRLAGGGMAAVYMQNSGQGNVINPYCSLLHPQVYGIGLLFIIGWRGEPGVHDEPQHVFQGQITLSLLKELGIEYTVIDKNTTPNELKKQIQAHWSSLMQGRSFAVVVRKGALTYGHAVKTQNSFEINRERAIDLIAQAAADDFIVSTTGKISRELYEISTGTSPLNRDQSTPRRISINRTFLTVGSMGHCSSIALGLALQRPLQRFWCLDGDGSLLMHFGAAAVIGSLKPQNFVHIVLNNAAHDSVGGMPTAAGAIDLPKVMQGLGYPYTASVNTLEELHQALSEVKARHQLSFIEIKCALGSRSALGRPKTSAEENKLAFIDELQKAVCSTTNR